MKEAWKDVSGFEGLYRISNYGNIQTLKSKNYQCKKEGYLTPTITPNGYGVVTLCNKSHREKWLVHRLVAVHFVPNPNGYPHINHKDENKLNNNCSNLEWCTIKYNNAYGTARIRQSETRSNPVAQYTLEGKLIAVYRSIQIASRLLGFSEKNIQIACRTPNATAYNYLWKRFSKNDFNVL